MFTYFESKFAILVFVYLYVKDGHSQTDTPYLMIQRENITAINMKPYDVRRKYTLDQKCTQGKPFGIGYQNYTPYVDSQWNIHSKSDNISGIFPHILIQMMSSCCPNSTVASATKMSSAYEIAKHFDYEDTEVDISFPVYGQEGKATRTFKTFAFVPVVTAPKIVILVPESISEDVGIRVQFLAQTITNAWPMWVFTMVSTCLAGLCMWLLDQKRNPSEFPPSLAGSWDGIWWAFITMTTVGYGDLSPKSVFGRIFSMLWISLGVIVISLFTGLVSAALNQTSNADLTIAGSKIGAVRGSIEYQVGVEHNADMKDYESHLEMLEDLKNSTSALHAAMIDNFALTAMSDELNKKGIRVKKELHHPVTYGMVLIHNSSKTEECFREYVKNHPQEVFESIAGKLTPVKNLSTVHVEVAAVGKAFYEQQIFKNIVYAECAILILALIIGITYEIAHRLKSSGDRRFTCIYREKNNVLEENHELTEKTIPTSEHINMPDEIIALLSEYDEYHEKWVNRVKSFYKSPIDKKTEALHSSPC